MKIKINTQAKLIQVEGEINRKKLNAILDKLFYWKGYRIESAERFIHWADPVSFTGEPLIMTDYKQIYNIEA